MVADPRTSSFPATLIETLLETVTKTRLKIQSQKAAQVKKKLNWLTLERIWIDLTDLIDLIDVIDVIDLVDFVDLIDHTGHIRTKYMI